MTDFRCYRCQNWPCDCADGCAIIHADCRQVLSAIGTFDLLLTDPPYGIGESRNKRGNIRNGRAWAASKDYGAATWDDTICQDAIDAALAVCQWQIIFGGNYYRLNPSSCWLVWDKDNGSNDYADCELAWTNFPKAVRRLKWKWHGMLQEQSGARKEYRVHPTQKPLAVIKWTLTMAPEGVATVLDPFLGSGTTLRAVKDAGLRGVGIEIEERYCAAAADRLSQGVLF